MKSVAMVSSPLIEHSMTILRDKHTPPDEFRRHADIVAKLVLIEATKALRMVAKKIETPLAGFDGQHIKDKVIVVPILRAGLAMLPAAQELLPAMSVGFIGLVRDEATAIADKYYEKLPPISPTDTVFIIDPMLATGGSMNEALKIVKAAGAKQILALTIISAPEGIKLVHDNHPDIPIITAALDERLDTKAYIVPGLGDFGDRYFGTEN